MLISHLETILRYLRKKIEFIIVAYAEGSIIIPHILNKDDLIRWYIIRIKSKFIGYI